jgi:hypothetical protein
LILGERLNRPAAHAFSSASGRARTRRPPAPASANRISNAIRTGSMNLSSGMSAIAASSPLAAARPMAPPQPTRQARDRRADRQAQRNPGRAARRLREHKRAPCPACGASSRSRRSPARAITGRKMTQPSPNSKQCKVASVSAGRPEPIVRRAAGRGGERRVGAAVRYQARARRRAIARQAALPSFAEASLRIDWRILSRQSGSRSLPGRAAAVAIVPPPKTGP